MFFSFFVSLVQIVASSAYVREGKRVKEIKLSHSCYERGGNMSHSKIAPVNNCNQSSVVFSWRRKATHDVERGESLHFKTKFIPDTLLDDIEEGKNAHTSFQ
ncbi:hypothetical protein AVEN_240549-1 [Araneus ventricosus]|uniref:Secreted protein n=1 Tax=Araneus ventricosus TaxID=182803 RepID=A0A4Y2GFD2_ARAVE|nr:hypothetical protein AVEN_240549-1 [Araneus ventricosus]